MPEAAARHARRTRDRRPDRGAGTLEHVGVLVLIGAVFAAVLALPVASDLSEAVRVAVCRITGGGDCAPLVFDRLKPVCMVASRDRVVGASVTAFTVKVGHDDNVAISELGNGKTTVTLTDTYQAGVSAVAGAKLDLAAVAEQLKARGYAEAGATGKGAYKVLYEFKSREEADAWVARNRGVVDQVTNSLLGVVGDGLEQGTNWIERKLGLQDDNNRAPDGVGFDLGVQATLGGGYGLSTVAGANAVANGGINGSVVFKKDGTSTFTGTATADASGEGALAFFGGKLGISGKAEYSVAFDDKGQPTTLTLTGEYSGTGTLSNTKNGLPISKTGKVSYGGSGEQGRRYTHTYSLDLRNPANRAAFDQAFVVAGTVALPVVHPGQGPSTIQENDYAALLDRIDHDAIQVRAAYATDGYGGTIGGAGEGFGVDATYKGTSAKLIEAESQDLSIPNSSYAPLSSCK